MASDELKRNYENEREHLDNPLGKFQVAMSHLVAAAPAGRLINHKLFPGVARFKRNMYRYKLAVVRKEFIRRNCLPDDFDFTSYFAGALQIWLQGFVQIGHLFWALLLLACLCVSSRELNQGFRIGLFLVCGACISLPSLRVEWAYTHYVSRIGGDNGIQDSLLPQGHASHELTATAAADALDDGGDDDAEESAGNIKGGPSTSNNRKGRKRTALERARIRIQDSARMNRLKSLLSLEGLVTLVLSTVTLGLVQPEEWKNVLTPETQGYPNSLFPMGSPSLIRRVQRLGLYGMAVFSALSYLEPVYVGGVDLFLAIVASVSMWQTIGELVIVTNVGDGTDHDLIQKVLNATAEKRRQEELGSVAGPSGHSGEAEQPASMQQRRDTVVLHSSGYTRALTSIAAARELYQNDAVGLEKKQVAVTDVLQLLGQLEEELQESALQQG
eukprot:GFYU01012515.1.p1 GENE.GFYU01012515.1~~GFYU01012515.1.p1  ORF type:complete len:443 (-),score=69.35 GFYU01012515.1:80-1408(-)